MKHSEEEETILNESPDYENQIKILEEEHKNSLSKRKFIILICGIIVGISTIFYVAYSNLYTYREYGKISNQVCRNVNLKTGNSLVPNLNVTIGKSCKPVYNIDYYNNGKAVFNVDLYGDRSEIFNPTNQLNEEKNMCILNCDLDGDGWPDYNLDIDGDGKADLNITDSENPKICRVNCDLNKDTIPDTNVDINNDGKADINITDDDYTNPKYNIDYKGNRKPTFNVKTENGIENQVEVKDDKGKCLYNCDLDRDGWPDYNIRISETSSLLSELIATEPSEEKIYYDKDKGIDWKCYFSHNLDGCQSSTTTDKNTYINIDVDGDGKADVNLSKDGGKTITNPINKPITINNIDYILNEDKNNDGWPDYNIDVDGDGKPDLNVTNGKDYICEKNCDTNNDGKPDYFIEYKPNQDQKYTIEHINIDIDYDGICDVNCDLDYDLIPDINIDTNGDNVPDINIDYNHDNKADFNLDINNDGKPEQNLDVYGLGTCNFNCVNGKEIINAVSSKNNCIKNCDTNDDGYPDTNVDINNDGVCDFNCENGKTNIDSNHDYFLDSKNDLSYDIMTIETKASNAFYIINPFKLQAHDIEPGWDGKYILYVKNNYSNAVAYNIYWTNVKNEFTDANNLNYRITRDGTTYLDNLKAPRGKKVLIDKVLIRPNTTIKYVMNIEFKETGVLQNFDSGKIFYGQLTSEVIK